MVRLGRFVLVIAIITAAGALNPIGMGAGLDILGLTERLVINSLQSMISALSFFYTLPKTASKRLLDFRNG